MIVIVPSRGRPHNIAELIECWGNTRSRLSWGDQALVVVDDDDPALTDYRALDLPAWAGLVVGPRLRLGPTLNLAAQVLCSSHEVIGFMGDDHRPRSPEWPIAIERAVTRLGIAYGNDLVQGENLPTAVFLDARIIRTLGYMVPPGMTHLYLDDFWKLLGQRLGTLTYLPDVVIEHCHPTAGTAPNDAGYAEVNSPEMYDADRRRFEEYVHGGEFEAALVKLEALR